MAKTRGEINLIPRQARDLTLPWMSKAPPTDEHFQPDKVKSRLGEYVSRMLSLNTGWGLYGRGMRPDGFYSHLFRFDAKRLTRMVKSAEHIIRCLIIWMAYRTYRDTEIEPVYSGLRLLDRNSSASGFGRSAPSPCSCATCTNGSVGYPTSDCAGAGAFAQANNSTEQDNQTAGGQQETGAGDPNLPFGNITEQTKTKPPIHPHFKLRGLPLYNPKLPAFRISMPGAAIALQPHKSGGRLLQKRRRLRNDDVLDCKVLMERVLRLSTLVDQIDERAARLAAHWAGMCLPPPSNCHPKLDLESRKDKPSSACGSLCL